MKDKKNNRLNVVVISTIYPNNVMPTRGVFTAQVVASLKKHCDIRVISPIPWFPKGKLFNVFSKWREFASIKRSGYINGIKVYYPRYPVIPRFFSCLHSLFMVIPLYMLLRKLNRQRKIDIIKTHWIFPDGVASTFISKIMNIPIVLVALGCDITHFPYLPFRRRQIIWALKKADSTMVVSEDLGERVKKLTGLENKISLAPDGVDFEKFKVRDKIQIRREIGLQEKGLMILQVASLDEVKGTRYLIDAILILKKTIKEDVFVYIIGEGHLKGSLLEHVNELGLSDSIFFLGAKQHDEVAKWMNASDLLCLTSIREGRPNVIIEAMASGLPVVATKVGGVPELLNNNNGLLAVPEDPEDIADKLEKCLANNWNKKKVASTVTHLSWGRTGRIYYEVLLKHVRQKNKKIF